MVNVTVGAAADWQIRASLAGMHTTIDPALWPALAAAVRG